MNFNFTTHCPARPLQKTAPLSSIPSSAGEGGSRLPGAVRVALAATLALLSPQLSHAGFHDSLAIDTVATSLANNVTASPPGILAIHYNPAGLSLLSDGDFVSTGLTLPSVKITSKFEADPNFKGFAGFDGKDPVAGTQTTTTNTQMFLPLINKVLNYAVGPSLGLSHRAPGSDWTFAIGSYAPFAVGMGNLGANNPAQFGCQSVYQQHLLYAAPAVSYRVSKTLSLGASVGLGQTSMGVSLNMRSPSDIVSMTKVLGDATQNMEIPVASELLFKPPWFGGGIGPYDKIAQFQMSLRDNFSPSYNLGLLWEPLDRFSFGLSYDSAITSHMTGTYNFNYSDQWQRMVNWFGSTPTLLTISSMLGIPNKPVPQQSGVVSSTVNFPQIVNAGIKVKPFANLRILSDLHWGNWSVIKNDKFTFDQDIQLMKFVKVLGYTGGNNSLVVDRHFRDTWDWGVAAEYDLLDWLTLRAGYEFRQSPVQRGFFDLLEPLPDVDLYGAGLGIRLKNGMVIDLAGGYMVNKCFQLRDNGSVNMNYSADFTKPVYNPYAGLDYEQKTVAYTASFKVTMPLSLMEKILNAQMEMANKALGALNPSRWFSSPKQAQ